MDVGQYIGKFLLKHKYCSLPGLGVFDLKKIVAQINKQSTEVSTPKYLVSFTPVGSIDDTFADFIANFENVSISNASNHIKEYCVMVKAEIAKTGKYEIDHIGRLTSVNNKLVFHQADDLDLGMEPAPIHQIEIKPLNNVDENGAIKKDDYSYPPANTTYRKSNDAWMKMLLPIGLVALLVIGGYFGYSYFKDKNSTSSNGNNEAIEAKPEVKLDSIQQATASTIDTTNKVAINADSIAVKPDSSKTNTIANTPIPVATGNAFNIAILTYDNEASATLKANKLKSYGNNTSVVARDGKYLVIANASHPLNDTLKLVDSLRKMFNPK
jgi:hypothetical protein